MKSVQLLVLTAACLLTIFLRTVPIAVPGTPATLDCMLALTLILGSGLRGKWWAPFAPLLVRLLTDTIIHVKTGYGFYPSMILDYMVYAGIVVTAGWIPTRRWSFVVAGALLSPLLFYAVSNFGVWWLWPETYSRSLYGLMQCYTIGLPHLRVSLVSNFAFCVVFFSAWNAVAVFHANRSADPAFPRPSKD